MLEYVGLGLYAAVILLIASMLPEASVRFDGSLRVISDKPLLPPQLQRKPRN